MSETTTEHDLRMCLDTLRQGGIIAYPTDTVWGLGCDPTDERAVEKIFSVKHRPGAKSMLLLAADMEMASKYVADIPAEARRLAEQSDVPLTIIYEGAHGISPRLIAEDGTVGIRIPKDEFCRRLCREFGKPIVSTSANKTGNPTARCYAEICREILEECDYACHSRHDEEPQGTPSAIIKVASDGRITRIR